MFPVYGPIGAIGFVIWLLIEAWHVITGPQNPVGWAFFLTMPMWAVLIGKIVGSLLERHSRHRN